MKVMYRAGAATIEVEGRDTKDCFAQIAAAAEVFGHEECGACGSHDIRPQVRERDGNHYYEIKCGKCGAEFAFGQKRADGSLFPRRRDKDGNWLPNHGWVKWQGKPSEDQPF